MLDVLIRGGWIADGAGSPPYLGDVAIEGGKIADVGRLGAAATAERVIDATGKIVCPGFVDPHSHSDFSILANPTAESTIRQGVTTEVVGNCGWSYAPVTDASEPTIRSRLHSFGFDKPTIPWSTFGEHLEFLSDVGHTPNFAWFVGHNAIRLAAGVSGLDAERRADGGDGGLRPRSDAVGSARDVDRARVQPGPGGDGRGAGLTRWARTSSGATRWRASSTGRRCRFRSV